MTVVDLTGVAITELLADPGVAGIVGPKVGPEFGARWTPPAIIVEQLGIDYSPGGQTRRARLQRPLIAAKCYGTTKQQAAQVANAVVNAMELRGPRYGSGGRLVHISLVETGGDVILDPDTNWPYGTVTFFLIGAQEAIA